MNDDRRKPHDAYFSALSAALADAGLFRPTLVIDRARLDANIAAVKATLAGTGLATRIVVKSLPAHGLIDAVAAGVETDRFMVFSGAMLAEMAKAKPRADFLLGKPLPVAQAAQTLDAMGPGVSPQWLVDTRERLAQYAELARSRGTPMRISLEIDVGLHRGGFASADAVALAVDAAQQAGLTVSGLMGYDPHVPRTPDPAKAFAQSQKAYDAAKAVLKDKLGADAEGLTYNTAGSPTYALHAQGSVGNEVAIGSAFVQPAGFDHALLAHHTPASFIATPALKVLARDDVPPSGLFALVDTSVQRAVFIHGGHWLATPVSPPGLVCNTRFGRSSNQELLTTSDAIDIAPDDTVFFRPTQSEAIFLQFGDIAIYEDGKIAGAWPTFPVSA